MSFVGNVLGNRPHLAQAPNNKRIGDLRSFVAALAALLAGGLGPALG